MCPGFSKTVWDPQQVVCDAFGPPPKTNVRHLRRRGSQRRTARSVHRKPPSRAPPPPHQSPLCSSSGPPCTLSPPPPPILYTTPGRPPCSLGERTLPFLAEGGGRGGGHRHRGRRRRRPLLVPGGRRLRSAAEEVGRGSGPVHRVSANRRRRAAWARAVVGGKKRKKRDRKPTETNVDSHALCLVVKTWARHKTTETVLNNGWRLVAVGNWRLAVGCGWWRWAAGGWWRLAAVGGWRSLGAVLKGYPSPKHKSGVLTDGPGISCADPESPSPPPRPFKPPGIGSTPMAVPHPKAKTAHHLLAAVV